MNKQTEAMKQALEQALEMLTDNREYIEANDCSYYLKMYDKVIAGAEKALAEQTAQQEPAYTYTSTQATRCARCGEHKHTPLRIDSMGGYVCLTCIDKQLCTPQAQQEPWAWLFQHEETGLTQCVDTQQVEWGFEKNNPRWQKIAPLYTTPQAPKEKNNA